MNTDQCWRAQIREILGICAADMASRREVAAISEYIEADYRGRFLIELLQNANDQAIDARRQDATVSRKPRQRGGGRGGSTSEREQDKPLHGRLGEIYMYELLRARAVSGFDDAAWQSENRNEYLGEGSGKDWLGCDFGFQDEAGSLTCLPGVRCLLEVKSSTGDAEGPFAMSTNEWNRVATVHYEENEIYLILRVARVNEAPALVDVLTDPYKLRGENKLQLVAADHWIYPSLVATVVGSQEPPSHPG